MLMLSLNDYANAKFAVIKVFIIKVNEWKKIKAMDDVIRIYLSTKGKTF